MKTILLYGVLGIIGFLFNPGTPVADVEIYIEKDGENKPVAYQKTGDNGKVTFANLGSGLYRISVVLPQQSGKWMRGSNRVNCALQVGYHNDKKTYYLHEQEGFFILSYSKLRRLENNNITPVYRQDFNHGNKQLEIGKFESKGNNGSISLSIRAQKPGKFKKLVEKVKDDVGMTIIRKAG